MDGYDVSVEKQKLLDKWNRPAEDQALARLVGVPVPEGDTRATAHVPMAELNHGLNPGNSGVDAALLYADDGDDKKDAKKAAKKAAKAAQKAAEAEAGSAGGEGDKYDGMNSKALKAEINSRNEGREGDAVLAKGGKVEELRDRLRSDDA